MMSNSQRVTPITNLIIWNYHPRLCLLDSLAIMFWQCMQHDMVIRVYSIRLLLTPIQYQTFVSTTLSNIFILWMTYKEVGNIITESVIRMIADYLMFRAYTMAMVRCSHVDKVRYCRYTCFEKGRGIEKRTHPVKVSIGDTSRRSDIEDPMLGHQ